jgi:GYF domain 2
MSDRSWFFAAGGQQQGPYRDAQFRDFVARGTVRPDTLVWTEGMAGWQKAGEIPGLFSGAAAPPELPRTRGAPPSAAGAHAGGPLSIDAGLWHLLGWSLVFAFGVALVIPAPWAATYFYRWIVARLHVPGRPNLAFTGQVGDIWYVFVLLGLCSYAPSLSGHDSIELILIPLQGFLSWMTLRWLAGNLASNGERLQIAFEGSALTYVGWYMLMYLSLITIVGWAWVIAAWMRWVCRNIGGTHREVVFNATGLEVLWRTLLFGFASVLVIPIPWVLRWYAQWYVSQFELVERPA